VDGFVPEEKGFYVVYGVASKAQLQAAINNPIGGKTILNGKEVFKASVEGIDEDNRFSVVLTGIPEIGYATKISVFAYYIQNSKETITTTVSTRSIAQVAINMAKTNESTTASLAIIESVKQNFNVLHTTIDGIAVTGSIYEVDRLKLKSEFLTDYNNKFGNALTASSTPLQYKNQFSTGLTEADNVTKNVSNSNLYKFFNDPIYQAKWGWILDYFISIDGTLHVERQSMALKGDGTYADYQLWNFIHFSATLYNFFNREHETLNY